MLEDLLTVQIKIVEARGGERRLTKEKFATNESCSQRVNDLKTQQRGERKEIKEEDQKMYF